MKLQDLQKYFEEAKANEVRFKGNCQDCGADVCIDITTEGKDKLSIAGGALYNPQVGPTKKDTRFFVKCDKCYSKDKTLINFRPCEVYSRVVGYLRPVSQWNNGKQAEFQDRKTFKL